MAYNEFAYFYDEFNGEADYDALYSYITDELKAHGITDGILADLGCGTGDLTLMLTQAGYDVIGIDRSEEMLSVLREKADELGLTGRLLLLKQDLLDLDNAAGQGVTAVMQPFVRSRHELEQVRTALARRGLEHLTIFAKIEDRQGWQSLPQWMDACDVVTVARGDLGSNLGLLHLPAAQKDIAARCRRAGKPFLVVTQLLHTMTEHPTPTRAEVLDVYNAVLDGASALMLTGETARGRYPLEAVRWLLDIARQAEEDQK